MSLHDFFTLNHTIVLFIYGLMFFVMGLAIFLQSRRHSQLRLAQDLRWLAAFGVAHGIHEWGIIFIPIQAAYSSAALINTLEGLQIGLLALSFIFLLMFGVVTLERRYPWLKYAAALCIALWSLCALALFTGANSFGDWQRLANICARYLIALPGSLLAAYGLWYQAKTSIEPLKIDYIMRTLRVTGIALLAYTFFGGMIVPPAAFFPANVLNYRIFDTFLGIPVQVYRTVIGFVLAVTIIRALEVFEIEVDRQIEQMEIERIQAAEREHIGQEIHDGAIQGVYSASLILEALTPLLTDNPSASQRLQQAKSVLNAVNQDLRSYMISLRAVSPPDPLIPSLQQLIADPRFRGLLDIQLSYTAEPTLKPAQVHHILAIVQESLSNTLRHARAQQVKIRVSQPSTGLLVELTDNGRGFAPESVQAGYGLRSMRDRARLIGGQVQIESAPHKGTTVRLNWVDDKG